MPARPAGAPRAVPCWLALLRPLPKREVRRVLLLLTRLDTRPGTQRIDVAAGELSVVRLAPHAEVHVSVGAIGVAVLDQPLRHLDDRRYLLRGAREDVRGRNVQLPHLLVELVDVGRGYLVERLSQ